MVSGDFLDACSLWPLRYSLIGNNERPLLFYHVLPPTTSAESDGIKWIDKFKCRAEKLVGINQWSAKYQSSINIRSRKFHLHHLHTIRLLQTELCWWWRCSFVITWSALWNVLHGAFFLRSTWSKSKYNGGRVDDQYKSPTWPLSQVGSHFWKQYYKIYNIYIMYTYTLTYYYVFLISG